jgi:hypothetical protein
MNEYLYLYRGGDPMGSPEEMQKTMKVWMGWFEELGKKGNLKDGGQPLDKGGKIVKGKSVTDGPFAEKDLVGGYSLVLAKDLAHAAELAKGCPLLQHGGQVEIRPVLKMG